MLHVKFEIHRCSGFREKVIQMDLKARVDVNCEQKDGQTENRTPMVHTAKVGVTKITEPENIGHRQTWMVGYRWSHLGVIVGQLSSA